MGTTKRTRAIAVVGALAIMALSVMPGASAATRRPPANDNVASASTISRGAGSVAGSNVGATFETGEPSYRAFAGIPTVWYVWTAPADGRLVLDTCRRFTFDTMLLIGRFTSDTIAFPSGFIEIADNDDWDDAEFLIGDPRRCSGVASLLVIEVSGGQAYHVGVGGFDGRTGSFVLSWRFTPANQFIV